MSEHLPERLERMADQLDGQAADLLNDAAVELRRLQQVQADQLQVWTQIQQSLEAERGFLEAEVSRLSFECETLRLKDIEGERERWKQFLETLSGGKRDGKT